MEKKREKQISKYLTYVLRHKPDSIGITLSKNGWVDVKELIEKSDFKMMLDFNEIKHVVDNQDPNKRRLSFSNDFCEIRANQGHSTEVELEFEEVTPPNTLYHGAPNKVVDSIMKTGLNRGKRHHVHLSPDKETAAIVGARRGEFIILEIEAMRLRADGHKIYMSENGVYLVDEVPSEYIKIEDNE